MKQNEHTQMQQIIKCTFKDIHEFFSFSFMVIFSTGNAKKKVIMRSNVKWNVIVK